ncbi:MAG: MlaD family protein [Terriglobales bacterium]
MRKRFVIVVLVVAIAAIVFLVVKPLQYRREVRAYFQDAQGLRAGASVRMAGVDIGSVTSVRVRPELSATPAEVTMALRTPYALKIPKDANVSLQTDGVLGPTSVEIEIARASGPPLENGGVLKSKEVVKLTPEQWIERVADIVRQRPCDTLAKSETATGSGSDKNSDSQRRK